MEFIRRNEEKILFEEFIEKNINEKLDVVFDGNIKLLPRDKFYLASCCGTLLVCGNLNNQEIHQYTPNFGIRFDQPLLFEHTKNYANKCIDNLFMEKEIRSLEKSQTYEVIDSFDNADPNNYTFKDGIFDPKHFQEYDNETLLLLYGEHFDIEGYVTFGPDMTRHIKSKIGVVRRFAMFGKEPAHREQIMICTNLESAAKLHRKTGLTTISSIEFGNFLTVCEMIIGHFEGDIEAVIVCDNVDGIPIDESMEVGSKVASKHGMTVAFSDDLFS